MARSLNLAVLICSFLLFLSPSIAKTSFRPKALVVPVTKDSSLQYLISINQRTPLVSVKLTVDLGGLFLWVDCEKRYVSSSFSPVRCNSAKCKLSGSGSCTTECYSNPSPGCYNNTCSHLPYNPILRTSTSGQIGQEVVSIASTNGNNPGRVVSVPKFLFTCTGTFLLERLASGVSGMAGLGRSKISLPSQFSAAFSFHRKFAICLSSSAKSSGVIFFGDGPYVILPGIDFSKSLKYTPLILNPVSTSGSYFQGDASADYFIRVKSIKINGKVVRFNSSLLSIDSEGKGGTKLSTVDPYTVMQTSIYEALVKAFVKEMAFPRGIEEIVEFVS